MAPVPLLKICCHHPKKFWDSVIEVLLLNSIGFQLYLPRRYKCCIWWVWELHCTCSLDVCFCLTSILLYCNKPLSWDVVYYSLHFFLCLNPLAHKTCMVFGVQGFLLLGWCLSSLPVIYFFSHECLKLPVKVLQSQSCQMSFDTLCWQELFLSGEEGEYWCVWTCFDWRAKDLVWAYTNICIHLRGNPLKYVGRLW